MCELKTKMGLCTGSTRYRSFRPKGGSERSVKLRYRSALADGVSQCHRR